MNKINRFKKKVLEEAAKNIVSSNPIEQIKESKKSTVQKEKTKAIIESNIEKESSKIIIKREEKLQMTKLGTSIRLDLKKNLDKTAKKYDRTTNNIVNIILDNLYDKENKKFNIEINQKESFKITSYHIKEEHFKAIENLTKTTGYNKSEIFNMLIEKGLSNIK